MFIHHVLSLFSSFVRDNKRKNKFAIFFALLSPPARFLSLITRLNLPNVMSYSLSSDLMLLPLTIHIDCAPSFFSRAISGRTFTQTLIDREFPGIDEFDAISAAFHAHFKLFRLIDVFRVVSLTFLRTITLINWVFRSFSRSKTI
jgi:hypothetical protein